MSSGIVDGPLKPREKLLTSQVPSRTGSQQVSATLVVTVAPLATLPVCIPIGKRSVPRPTGILAGGKGAKNLPNAEGQADR